MFNFQKILPNKNKSLFHITVVFGAIEAQSEGVSASFRSRRRKWDSQYTPKAKEQSKQYFTRWTCSAEGEACSIGH